MGSNGKNGGNLHGYTLAAILKIFKERCFKTSLCHFYMKLGECSYGTTCTFAHGKAELRGPGRPSSVTLAVAASIGNQSKTGQKNQRSKDVPSSGKRAPASKGSNPTYRMVRQCALCFDDEDVTNNDLVKQACGHEFHRECLRNVDGLCPYCGED